MRGQRPMCRGNLALHDPMPEAHSMCGVADGPTVRGPRAQAALHLSRQATSPGRYAIEQALAGLSRWVPTPIGMATRAVFYRLRDGSSGCIARFHR